MESLALCDNRVYRLAPSTEFLPDEPNSGSATLEALAVLKRYRRGQSIYSRDDPTDFLYQIKHGMARKSAHLWDGRRRIVDFLIPDDFFGFTSNVRHYFDVEAIVEGTVVAFYPRRKVELLAESDPVVAREVRDLLLEALARSQRRILILGGTTALAKVSAFLVEVSSRSRTHGKATLQMSRYDIADYLALSVETVSRSLTVLQAQGAIRLSGKHSVSIVDRLPLGGDGDDA